MVVKQSGSRISLLSALALPLTTCVSLDLSHPGYKVGMMLMQIKATTRNHLTPVKMPSSKSLQIINVGEGVRKREPSYTMGGNVSWCSHYRKQYRGSLKKLKVELLYDPAILGIYPKKKKALIQKDTCTLMFTSALFTIPRYGSNLSVHQQMSG